MRADQTKRRRWSGQANVAWSQARHAGIDGVKRPGSFDTPIVANALANYTVSPIHPFTLELRVSETEVLYEGFYAFDPAAFGPACSSVRLVLYSEKTPTKPDTRVIEPAILQQVRRDFDVGKQP